MATHSSILAWKIPRTEEPSGSMHARCLSDNLATDPLSCSCLGRVRALSCVWDCPPGQYSFWVTSLWDLRCPLPPVPCGSLGSTGVPSHLCPCGSLGSTGVPSHQGPCGSLGSTGVPPNLCPCGSLPVPRTHVATVYLLSML